jgi:hypothetical protein
MTPELTWSQIGASLGADQPVPACPELSGCENFFSGPASERGACSVESGAGKAHLLLGFPAKHL